MPQSDSSVPDSPKTDSPTAALLIIGNEILSGRTHDVNLKYLGGALADVGIPLQEVRVVPDTEATIIGALNPLRQSYTYVFTTGGIGPTHDDITTACVARAFGVPVVRHAEAEARLQAYYGAGKLNAARLKMAEVPEGATLIDNPVSGAPGFRLGNVHVLAGVPSIAQAMFENIRHTLVGGKRIVSAALSAYLKEGDMAAPLGDIQNAAPTIDIGSYPFAREGKIGCTIVARGTDEAAIADVMAKVRQLMVSLGGKPFEM